MSKEMNSFIDFKDAIEELRKQLYQNELYREGSIYITYDRNDHKFHVNEKPLVNSSNIPIDEFEGSPEYCQIVLFELRIDDLDEQYDSMKRSHSFNDCTESEIWEMNVDRAIDDGLETIDPDPNLAPARFELDIEYQGLPESEFNLWLMQNDSLSFDGITKKMDELGISKEIQRHIEEIIKEN